MADWDRAVDSGNSIVGTNNAIGAQLRGYLIGHQSGSKGAVIESFPNAAVLRQSLETWQRERQDVIQISDEALETFLDEDIKMRPAVIEKSPRGKRPAFLPLAKAGDEMRRGSAIGILQGGRFLREASTGRILPLPEDGILRVLRDCRLSYVAGGGPLQPDQPVYGDTAPGGGRPSLFLIPDLP